MSVNALQSPIPANNDVALLKKRNSELTDTLEAHQHTIQALHAEVAVERRRAEQTSEECRRLKAEREAIKSEYEQRIKVCISICLGITFDV